jgi:hypothetical protein
MTGSSGLTFRVRRKNCRTMNRGMRRTVDATHRLLARLKEERADRESQTATCLTVRASGPGKPDSRLAKPH